MCVCVCVACAFANKSLDSLATLLTSVPCHSFWWRRLSAPHYFHGGKSPRRNALTSLGSFCAELLILKILLQCAVFYLIYRNIFMLLRQRESQVWCNICLEHITTFRKNTHIERSFLRADSSLTCQPPLLYQLRNANSWGMSKYNVSTA